MENNNYLSSGVNYLPLTILDKDHATFINQLAPFPTYDGTKIGNDGRYSFGFGKPQQFKFYDSNTEIYDVAGIKRGDDESGVFVNNNGDRGIQVWLYFGDNYNLDESVKSGPAGSEGYTAVEDGMIGYWKRYQFILPNTSMQIPWLQDDVVGAQSNRMYFQYRGGSVPGYSLEDWNGTGGTHNREWYYNSNASGNYNYSAEELIGGGYLGNLTEYDNLTDIETASSNAEMDSISIRLTKVTGALFVDGTPRNNSNVLDTLLINTDDDVYLDGDWQSSTEVRTEGAFTGWNWGPVSSNSVEIDNLINQGPNGEVQWGDTVNIQIEGQLHRSHILINNLEIHPILYSYSQSTNLTTIQVKAAFNQLTDLFGNETQREVYGGSEGLTIESFEHHYSRMNTGILSGFVEGSLVAGAIVQAMDIDKNLMTVVTDGSGGYTFPRAAFGNITAKGGSNPVDGSLYISDDNENLIDDDEIPVAKGTQIGHSSLGGIVSPVSTIATNLLKSMSKSEALESMEETAPSLFGVDLSADDMAAYLAVGLVGFSDANDNTFSQKYNKILQLNKKIEEQIISFSTGAVSDTASAKDKNKAANTYVKSLTNIIDKGASGKIDAIAASYISENQDSNLGNIDDSTFANNSPEDLIYLTAALAANDIESKIPESSRKLDKNDLKDVSKVIAESITSASFDISSNDSETAFIEAQSINGQRRQGVFAVIDAKSKGQSVSKSTFDAKNSSSVFNIVKEPGGEYKLNSTNAKKPNGQSVSSKIKLTDNRYDFRNSKELRTPSVEINGKSSTLSLSNGRVDNSEQSGNSTIKWKYEGEKKTYLLRYDNLATTYINKHEVVFNSEEFMINRKGEAWNGQSVENWFTASNGFNWYTEGSDGLGQVEGHHQHPSLFLPKYKFLSGSHLKFDNGEGEVRNWNIVDYNTNRQVAKPGSAEEYNILLYFSNFISFIESEGDTTLTEALSGAIQGNRNVDSDSDGVADIYDAFPNDASEVMDSDGDNVGDNADAFPNDASETVDSDGDNVGDNADAFPNDASETTDSDGDNVGDNADEFPNDASENVDSDKDGVGDNADAFPNDASETVDSDKDGVGDNADEFPNDASETVDSDKDGVGDNADAFPNDASETADSDGDGVGDNEDDLPNDPTETVDTDGDGTGDNADTDDDNDTYSDEDEIEAETDPKDSEDFPQVEVLPQERQSGEITKNLKGFFTTNETASYAGEGTTINEISGERGGTSGTLRNGVSYVNNDTSVNVPYLVFDGVDDHFNWAHNPNVKLGLGNRGPGMTYSLWLKPNAKTAHIINNDAYGTSYYYGVNIGFYSDGRIFTNEMNQGHSQRKGKYNRDLTLFEEWNGQNPLTEAMNNGSWVHVCITYADFGGGKHKVLYINGEPWGDIANGNGFASDYRRYVDYTKGNGGSVGIMGASTAYYSGGFESVKIFEGPLSAWDVLTEYEARKGLFNLGGGEEA